MTLSEYAAQWCVQRTGRLTPNAVRAYTSALRLHVLPALGHMDVRDITTMDVRTWLSTELRNGRSANSVKAFQGALSTVLMDAVIDGHVTHNAAHGAGRRLLPIREKAPKAMTPEELHSFLAATRLVGSGWAADAFLVYSRTGLRLGELLALQKRSLILDDAALRVEQTYHGGSLGFGPPKGGKARLIEFSLATLHVLERRAQFADTPGGFLFPGADPRRPMHPTTVEWAFEQAASIAQLGEHYTVHSLRHTYASLLLAQGAPPQWVQQQLGHSHYGITVDLYGSWLRQRRPDLTALLDREPGHHGITRLERSAAKVIPLPLAKSRIHGR